MLHRQPRGTEGVSAVGWAFNRSSMNALRFSSMGKVDVARSRSLLAGVSSFLCSGLEYPPYDVVDNVAYMEVRRYHAGTWLTVFVPHGSFLFCLEYANELLMDYFYGDNYDGRSVPFSTPMLLSIDNWNLRAPRHASFYVPELSPKDPYPPAPRYPTYLQRYTDAVYYVKTIQDSDDFRVILHHIACALADLTISDQPFEMNEIILAFYGYPRMEGCNASRPDEIWIKKKHSLRNDFSDFSIPQQGCGVKQNSLDNDVGRMYLSN